MYYRRPELHNIKCCMKKLLIGPYIGSFKNEINIFIPYVNYLLDVLEYDKAVVSSHANREFLYNHVDVDFCPVYGNITRNELCQKGIVFEGINKQQYNQISKMIKETIGGVSEQYTLSYIKNQNNITTTQLLYKRFDKAYTKTDKVVFIPDNSKICRELYHWLIEENYNISVVGDMNNGLAVYNELLKRTDYSNIVYKMIFEQVHNSLFVITPCAEWALICNLQGIPVLYWGDMCSQYKSDGIYGFNNKNVISIRNFNLSMIGYMHEKVS